MKQKKNIIFLLASFCTLNMDASNASYWDTAHTTDNPGKKNMQSKKVDADRTNDTIIRLNQLSNKQKFFSKKTPSFQQLKQVYDELKKSYHEGNLTMLLAQEKIRNAVEKNINKAREFSGLVSVNFNNFTEFLADFHGYNAFLRNTYWNASDVEAITNRDTQSLNKKELQIFNDLDEKFSHSFTGIHPERKLCSYLLTKIMYCNLLEYNDIVNAYMANIDHTPGTTQESAISPEQFLEKFMEKTRQIMQSQSYNGMIYSGAFNKSKTVLQSMIQNIVKENRWDEIAHSQLRNADSIFKLGISIVAGLDNFSEENILDVININFNRTSWADKLNLKIGAPDTYVFWTKLESILSRFNDENALHCLSNMAQCNQIIVVRGNDNPNIHALTSMMHKESHLSVDYYVNNDTDIQNVSLFLNKLKKEGNGVGIGRIRIILTEYTDGLEKQLSPILEEAARISQYTILDINSLIEVSDENTKQYVINSLYNQIADDDQNRELRFNKKNIFISVDSLDNLYIGTKKESVGVTNLTTDLSYNAINKAPNGQQPILSGSQLAQMYVIHAKPETMKEKFKGIPSAEFKQIIAESKAIKEGKDQSFSTKSIEIIKEVLKNEFQSSKAKSRFSTIEDKDITIGIAYAGGLGFITQEDATRLYDNYLNSGLYLQDLMGNIVSVIEEKVQITKTNQKFQTKEISEKNKVYPIGKQVSFNNVKDKYKN